MAQGMLNANDSLDKNSSSSQFSEYRRAYYILAIFATQPSHEPHFISQWWLLGSSVQKFGDFGSMILFYYYTSL